MKTKDGYGVKRKGTYFLVLGRQEFSPLSLPRIVRCVCEKIGTDCNRHQIADFKYGKYNTLTYVYVEDPRLFKNLQRAKEYCLKILDTFKEDFEEAFKKHVHVIQRTKK